LERPDLWKIYLNEAEGIFRSRGFEGTLRRTDLEEGNGVPLFILGFDADGNAVAGVRFHGPLEGSHQAAIIDEMASSPEIGIIRDLIDHEIRLGALEVKGAWSKGASVVGARLLTAISRSVTHGMNWLGAEFAVAALATRRVGCRSAHSGYLSPTSATARSPSGGPAVVPMNSRRPRISRPIDVRPSNSFVVHLVRGRVPSNRPRPAIEPAVR
jgi:hypothetical protein